MVVIAAIFGLLAAINLVQVFLGRKVFRPEQSVRPPAQLRRESALAAVAMGAVASTFLGFVWAIVIAAIALWAIFQWRIKAPVAQPENDKNGQDRAELGREHGSGWHPHPDRPNEGW